MDWKCYRNDFVNYIKKIEKFTIDVITILDITDSSHILDKSIDSLKYQSNEPYILLIVCTHAEKTIAIKHNIDFYWTTERNQYTRYNDSLKYIKGNFKYVNHIMLSTTNDIFLKNWIKTGVDMINKKNYMIAGKNYNYLIDNNNKYKRNINFDHIKNTPPFNKNIILYSGIIISKILLNKIEWDILNRNYLNNIYLGIFSIFFKQDINLKIGIINNSDVVTILTEQSYTNINDFKDDKTFLLEVIKDLPVLDQYPLNELNISVVDSKGKNRTVYPPQIINKEIPKETPKEIPEEIKINLDKEFKKKIDIPMIIIKKPKTNPDKKVKKNKIILPGERREEQPIQIPMIKRKKPEPELIKKNTRIIIAPQIQEQPTNKINQIPMIFDKSLILNNNKNYSLSEINKSQVLSSQLIFKTKTVILILSSGLLDNITKCIEYINKQTVKTDYLLVLNEDIKLKLPYIVCNTDSEHIKIQYAIKQIKQYKTNNLQYISFIYDYNLIEPNWIKENITKADNENLDIIGSPELYLFNKKDNQKYLLKLVFDNLNFVIKHYRQSWSFFTGRFISVNLLNKLEWELFSNNFDIDIEVFFALKLSLNGCKINKITNVTPILTYITDIKLEEYQNTNHLELSKITDNSSLIKIHSVYQDVLGTYTPPEKRAPIIYNIPEKRPINNEQNNKKKKYTSSYHEVEISIVLPTLNGYPHISKTLECINNQTFKNYELIIINDGSTQSLFREYLDRQINQRTKVIHLEKNGGLPNALNIGINNSRGKYWTWISDDNTVTNDFLQKLRDKLEEDYGFVYSNYNLYDINSTNGINIDINYNSINDILDGWMGMPSYMWRKELIDQIGKFDVKIQGVEDYEFVVKTFISCNHIAHIDDYLFNYYKRKNTLSTKLYDIIPKLKAEVIKKYKFSSYLQELHNLLYNSLDIGDIFLFMTDTDYRNLYQRPQQIMKVMSKKHLVLYVCNKHGVNIERDNNIILINRDLFDIYLHNFNLSARNIFYYFVDPKFYTYRDLIHPQCQIFDLIDNPVEEFEVWNKNLKSAIDTSDIIFYSSVYLEKVIKKINPEKPSYLISNGCDYDHFTRTHTKIPIRPVKIPKFNNKIIIGYYGAITSWLDQELIRKIANLTGVHLVMIGGIKNLPTYNQTFHHHNITWIEHVDYLDLPDYLYYFDICLIPFKLTEMIKGCNPIKIYEYCTTGKIILSTELSQDIPIDIYHKIDHNNYEKVILDIINNQEYKNIIQKNILFSKKHDWTTLVRKLENKLKIDYTIIYPPTVNYDFLMQRPAQIIRATSKISRIRSIFIEKNHNSKEIKNYKFMILNKSTFTHRLKYYTRGRIIYYYTYPDNIIYKKLIKPDYTIFDLIDNPTDEFSAWDNSNLLSSMTESDLFVCSAPIMYHKYKDHNKNCILVSNGCDVSHFSCASVKLSIQDKFLDFIKDKIVIGYYGAHATWVDYDLIKKIADYKPNIYTVIMIGNAQEYAHSFHHDNITWIEHQTYDKLPTYLSYFDICMIPFKLTDMIRGCDPIKFYEYLATGKPVITTAIEPLSKYNRVCYFMNHHNYGSIIDQAHRDMKDNNKIVERIKVAKNNSWCSKAETILTKIITYDIEMTILYPPYIIWDRMFQRPQQMLTHLSKIKGVRAVFIDYQISAEKHINKNLILVQNYEQAKKYLLGDVIIYYNNPQFSKELSKYKYDKVIFELVDNPVDEFSNWMDNIQNAISSADYVSITSNAMLPLVSKYTDRITVIPNGGDYEHFSKQITVKPVELININKKIIGYYGAHAPWVDFDLIKKIADIDNIHVVMIGKMDNVYNLSFEHKNISWLGLKDYHELPNYLYYFDVCMIPFKLTEMIKGCDPIKFYEYSSAGKPVIASRMNELTKFGDIIYFIDHDNYRDMINKAIKESNNRDLILLRQKIAKNNSWSNRAEKLLEII
jgi:glycosyltransferase involved in cell wall biosynthesis